MLKVAYTLKEVYYQYCAVVLLLYPSITILKNFLSKLSILYPYPYLAGLGDPNRGILVHRYWIESRSNPLMTKHWSVGL